MKVVRDIPYDSLKFINFKFVFASSHYDIHLEGICKYNNKLHEFRTDYNTEICTIYSLTFWEKVKWIKKKKLFEWCIGYHFSYPHRLKKDIHHKTRKPRWFWQFVFDIYYDRKKKKKNKHGNRRRDKWMLGKDNK